MTSYVSIETEGNLGFDLEEVTNQVLQAVMEEEACPYDVTVNLTLTDNDEIQAVNASFRQIDRATDVLSFPNLHFETPGDFSEAEDHEADCFDPDTGELMLGDIMISEDKVREQAEAYGHSLKREFAFLVAHSLFHLCGYDHMEEDEAKVMESKQEAILQKLKITRE
ncbi:MAG: rRNA maturation RNase YbeY [Lachnospiraceae bacterium]|jgi:probable rRNA maturation factor|nr:rRNA maturation RNase YbeY [Lachnospiraceae bacterium]